MPDDEDLADLADAIAQAAAGPKSATGDNGSQTNYDLKDLIEADKYLAGKITKRGFRLTKLGPGGTA